MHTYCEKHLGKGKSNQVISVLLRVIKNNASIRHKKLYIVCSFLHLLNTVSYVKTHTRQYQSC